MASIPFASRYRMIDFMLSSMVNCGIDHVSVMANNNYFSLIGHLGSGRPWDLARKHGGLNVIPPFAEKGSKPYIGRVGALANILDFLKEHKEKYVVICDSNLAANYDFNAMIKAHEESKADVTIAYKEMEIPAGFKNTNTPNNYYYTLDINNGRVNKIYVNCKEDGIHNFSLNIYVLERELLLKLVTEASLLGQEFFERDILLPQLDRLQVHAYAYEGYVAYISNLKTYFDENMKLLDEDNLNALFGASPIYTKIRDDNPTRYVAGAAAKNIMAADGCIIEGEVENSILFRGVKVSKGAKIKNCILMQDTVVEAGAELEYIITDKNVTITADKAMKGTETYPVYIPKYHNV